MARKILWEPEMRQRLVDLAPDDVRENFKQSLENDALILSTYFQNLFKVQIIFVNL